MLAAAILALVRLAFYALQRRITGLQGTRIHAIRYRGQEVFTPAEVTLLGPGVIRQVAWVVPEGWVVDTTSMRDRTGTTVAGTVTTEYRGTPALVWASPANGPAPITVTLHRAAVGIVARDVAGVRVATARSTEEREAEGGRALTAGPAVEFFAPQDGIVLPSDRLFVGVRGEAGAPIALFDGDSVLGQAELRPDGVHDFIAVQARSISR